MAYRPKDTQERILHRLKITRGHLNKVISMIEEDAYCIDILHQSEAVVKALQQTENLILESHLNSCVVDHIKAGQTQKAVEELMEVFKRKGK